MQNTAVDIACRRCRSTQYIQPKGVQFPPKANDKSTKEMKQKLNTI